MKRFYFLLLAGLAIYGCKKPRFPIPPCSA